MKRKLSKYQTIDIFNEIIQKYLDHVNANIKARSPKALTYTAHLNSKLHAGDVIQINYLDVPIFTHIWGLDNGYYHFTLNPPTLKTINQQFLWLSNFETDKEKESMLNKTIYNRIMFGGGTTLKTLLYLKHKALECRTHDQIIDYLYQYKGNTNITTHILCEIKIKSLGIEKFDNVNGKLLGTGSDGKLYQLKDKFVKLAK